MPLASIKYRWPNQISGGSQFQFTVETLALTNALTIFDPLLRVHNMGVPFAENIELNIEYVASFGTLPDPLNSGTFREFVIQGLVLNPQGTIPAMAEYDFSGISLDREASGVVSVSHIVTINNLGTNPVIVQNVLYGKTEVGGQYNAGSTIFSGVAS